MRYTRNIWFVLLAVFVAVGLESGPASAQKKPNILVIMGDDVGWFNIGAYHRGNKRRQHRQPDRPNRAHAVGLPE